MSSKNTPTWHFIDSDGTFELVSPDKVNYLYFPLVNRMGMMSCITPTLHGDIKTGQNSFLTRPVSVEDLHESRAARNVWVNINGHLPWSAAGNSAHQISQRFSPAESDEVKMEGGLLWHTVTRTHRPSGLAAQITSLVPENDDHVELMKVTLINHGDKPLDLTTTIAVPIFGRSADNLRDHRHVTSLLNRINIHANGVVVKPSLSFDENGHLPNDLYYAVLACDRDGGIPSEIFPLVEEFRGDGGTLDWPEAVIKQRPSQHRVGDDLEGYETLGGMRFSTLSLEPGKSYSYVVMMTIYRRPTTADQLVERYGDAAKFEKWHAATRQYWADQLDKVRVQTADSRFDGWMRWVSAQPVFRQLFGNSFLPYHDYGRGGRGWRDLWQDILGLLLLENDDVTEALFGHFAGVRFDGSNATIIGHKPGEFKADRNNIPRVWMDHGAWPLLTTRMFIDWTGNLNFLLTEQTYFKDRYTHRSRNIDQAWEIEQGTKLCDASGTPYYGSIFEHLLIQNLVPFFNVGEHNCILLEDADWNDALDMAPDRGESVAFSAFYAGNLKELADLADLLAAKGPAAISIAAELTLLLDTLFDVVAYDDPSAKRERLGLFLERSARYVSGDRMVVSLEALASDLRAKSDWLKELLREQEWLEVGGHGWFNGYYDNNGQRIEGIFDDTIQMTLSGQVFQLMSGVATQKQTIQVADSVKQHLYAPALHGLRLNTRFEHHTDALGRIFGFAHGHKENGAVFNHMSVMYAYALFKRGLHEAGNQILRELYEHCQDSGVSNIYPGLPEYIDPDGRCVYPYLTGSASWYLLTLVTQVFGVRGHLGDLLIAPVLETYWFDENGQATLRIPFANRLLQITIHNPQRLDPALARPGKIVRNGQNLETVFQNNGLLIRRHEITEVSEDGWQQLDVYLTERPQADR